MIKTPSYVKPSNDDLGNMKSYLDGEASTLIEYGIADSDVSDALAWLVKEESGVPTIVLADTLRGRSRFIDVVHQVLKKPRSLKDSAKKPNLDDMCVILSDPWDDEASSAAGVMASKISEKVFGFVSDGICVTADYPNEAGIDRRTEHARAVMVLLSKHVLEKMVVIRGIIAATAAKGVTVGDVVPITIPGFHFPKDNFYKEMLPSLWGRRESLGDVAVAKQRLEEFFHWIAVPLSTMASDLVLESQTEQLILRIPKTSITKSKSITDTAKTPSEKGKENVLLGGKQRDTLGYSLK
jgi:hypothetical protein